MAKVTRFANSEKVKKEEYHFCKILSKKEDKKITKLFVFDEEKTKYVIKTVFYQLIE